MIAQLASWCRTSGFGAAPQPMPMSLSWVHAARALTPLAASPATEVDLGRPSWGRYVSWPHTHGSGGARHFVGQCHRHGALHQQGTQIPLAHFGNGTGAGRPCGALRRDPDPGGKFPTVPEVRHVRRIGGQRKRRDGSDAGVGRHEK